jgi:hypothetical protein
MRDLGVHGRLALNLTAMNITAVKEQVFVEI